MKKYRYEMMAGIFVLVGLICVGYMTVRLGKFRFLGSDSYPLYARFSSVSGLRAGNAVEMLGLEIGEVADFKMDQEALVVLAELRIRREIKVYEDAVASIKTAGLIGDKYVSLDPGGSGKVMNPGATITQTESPPDISDLIGKYAFGSVGKGEKENK